MSYEKVTDPSIIEAAKGLLPNSSLIRLDDGNLVAIACKSATTEYGLELRVQALMINPDGVTPYLLPTGHQVYADMVKVVTANDFIRYREDGTSYTLTDADIKKNTLLAFIGEHDPDVVTIPPETLARLNLRQMLKDAENQPNHDNIHEIL